jgi:hypothetical protein
MLLNELLDSKVKITVKIDRTDEFETSATINGRTIVFRGELDDDGQEGDWFVVFGEPGEKNPKMLKYSLTGNGGELEVFSMVKDSLIMMVKKNSPDRINFVASKEKGSNTKRADLYARLFKRFTIPGYKFERLESPDYEEHVEFCLSKVDTSINTK